MVGFPLIVLGYGIISFGLWLVFRLNVFEEPDMDHYAELPGSTVFHQAMSKSVFFDPIMTWLIGFDPASIAWIARSAATANLAFNISLLIYGLNLPFPFPVKKLLVVLSWIIEPATKLYLILAAILHLIR